MNVDFASFLAHERPRVAPTLRHPTPAALEEQRDVLVALEGLARSRSADLLGTVGPRRSSSGYVGGSSFNGDPEPAWVTRVRADLAERKRQQPAPKRSKPVIPKLQVEFDPLVRPSLDVHLPLGSLEAIQRELRWGSQEKVEVGGFLWSNQVPSRAGPLLVAKASEPAPDSKHGHSRLRLGLGRHVKREFPSYLSHLVQCGDFHSHPSRNGTPSRNDYESWAERLRCSDVGLPYYVGLIVTRGECGWDTPLYRAYVTYQKEGTHFVCEPARIVQP